MAGLQHSGRAEKRSLLIVSVELHSFENATFEITNTLDVSPHGARVLSKTVWAPNQRVSVRALNGCLESPARIIYCKHFNYQSSIVGLELLRPEGAWPGFQKSFKASSGK